MFPSDYPSLSPVAWQDAVILESFDVEIIDTETGIMDDATIAIFERVCGKQFLPEYLPLVYGADYGTIDCKVLSQSKGAINRRLQKEVAAVAFSGDSLSVLMQVSSDVILPDEVEFEDLVQTTFMEHGAIFKNKLAVASPFFESVPDEEPSAGVTRSAPGSDGADKKLIFTLVGAVAGGIFVALALLLLARRYTEAKRAAEVDFNKQAELSFLDEIFSIDDDEELGYEPSLCAPNNEFSLGMTSPTPIIPPTPIGLSPIMTVGSRETGPMESSDAISPIVTVGSGETGPLQSSAVIEAGRRAERSSSTPRSVASASPRQGISPLSNMATMVAALEEEKSPLEADPLGLSMTSSDVEWKLENPHLPLSTKYDVQDDDSSTTVSELHGLSLVPTDGKSFESKRRSFFGGGRRKKYSDRVRQKRINEERHLQLIQSRDSASVDFERPAGTPQNNVSSPSSQALERCESMTPTTDFVGRKRTPHGREFVQMNTASASHAGAVLDDLSRMDRQILGGLPPTATADTPRANNRKPPFPRR